MADPSKTEAATPKRRNEVRHRGQTAKSPDLGPAIVALAGFVAFQSFGSGVVRQLEEMIRGSIQAMASPEVTLSTLTDMGRETLLATGRIVFPLLAILLIASLATHLAQVGLLFTAQPLRPQLNRLNLLVNARRMLISKNSLLQLVKSMAKTAVVTVIVWNTVRGNMAEILSLGDKPLREGVERMARLSIEIGIKAASVLLLIGIADYFYQRRTFLQGIKMTKNEVKDEMRASEGDPKIKGRQRRVRLESFQRMMQAVPTADVIITNPTHLAVALKYDQLAMNAPRVVAKGKDLVAQRIREIAEEHNIAIVENVPLAHALFKGVPIGREIPAHLYQAVAEVLAFVFRVRHGLAQRVA